MQFLLNLQCGRGYQYQYWQIQLTPQASNRFYGLTRKLENVSKLLDIATWPLAIKIDMFIGWLTCLVLNDIRQNFEFAP